MVRFAEVFPDQNILHAVCAQLSWSHLRRIICIEDQLKRDFYAEIGRILLSPTHWRLEALGADRLARFRERFEQLMRQRVTFTGERRDDLGGRLRMNEPKFDPVLVPPTLLRDTRKVVVTTN
jgi:hypothetical protein